MSDKPNLIYVFADQLRYSSLGCNGDELAKTPNIDEFSEECTVMDNACSGHPVCAPYRASLLTGKYTTSTGMTINEIRMSPNHRTFAHVLNENGYETGYLGKWHLYAAQLGHHFDVKNSFIPKGPDRLGFDGYFAAYNFHHKYYAPYAYYHLDTPEKIYAEGYEPDFQTDLAIEKIKELADGDKPFAFFLSIGTPHDPWTPDNVPEEYYSLFKDVQFPKPENYSPFNDRHADMWARLFPWERKELNSWKQCYYAMCANLDYNIGRLIKALKENHIDENTIIVFTSDHGEMFGAHGRRAKNIFYDEAVRVPFMIKWGDKLRKERNFTCFNTVDIMPTLLSMMGLPIPEAVQGEDISQAIVSDARINNPSLMMGTGPTAIWGNGREWRAIRDEQYTYATYLSDKSEYLFDNINDPYQMNNLIDSPNHKEIKEKLKSQMYGKMKKIGDEFEKNSFYKKNWVTKRVIHDELPPRSKIKQTKQ